MGKFPQKIRTFQAAHSIVSTHIKSIWSFFGYLLYQLTSRISINNSIIIIFLSFRPLENEEEVEEEGEDGGAELDIINIYGPPGQHNNYEMVNPELDHIFGGWGLPPHLHPVDHRLPEGGQVSNQEPLDLENVLQGFGDIPVEYHPQILRDASVDDVDLVASIAYLIAEVAHDSDESNQSSILTTNDEQNHRRVLTDRDELSHASTSTGNNEMNQTRNASEDDRGQEHSDNETDGSGVLTGCEELDQRIMDNDQSAANPTLDEPGPSGRQGQKRRKTVSDGEEEAKEKSDEEEEEDLPSHFKRQHVDEEPTTATQPSQKPSGEQPNDKTN